MSFDSFALKMRKSTNVRSFDCVDWCFVALVFFSARRAKRHQCHPPFQCLCNHKIRNKKKVLLILLQFPSHQPVHHRLYPSHKLKAVCFILTNSSEIDFVILYELTTTTTSYSCTSTQLINNLYTHILRKYKYWAWSLTNREAYKLVPSYSYIINAKDYLE